MRLMIIGSETSGELAEQPGDVNLFSPTSCTSSVLRKADTTAAQGWKLDSSKE